LTAGTPDVDLGIDAFEPLCPLAVTSPARGATVEVGWTKVVESVAERWSARSVGLMFRVVALGCITWSDRFAATPCVR